MGTPKVIFTDSECHCWHRRPRPSAAPTAPHGQRCPAYEWSWKWTELLSCSWPFQGMGMERRGGEKGNHPSWQQEQSCPHKAKGEGLGMLTDEDIAQHLPNENARSSWNLKQMKCQNQKAVRDTRVLLVTNNIHHWNAGVSQSPSQDEPCSRGTSKKRQRVPRQGTPIPWLLQLETLRQRILVLPPSSTEMATAHQKTPHGNKFWRLSETLPCTAILLCCYIRSGKAKAEDNHTDINKVF